MLSFVLASTLRAQTRAFSFLSFQDTIFAIRKRGGWGAPTRDTEFPREQLELAGLGLSSVKFRSTAFVEPWSSKTASWMVACEDFDEVMSWCVEPHYPRRLRRRPELRAKGKQMAMDLFRRRGYLLTSIKEPQVYSVDLDGTGHEEILVDVSGETKTHSVGIAFMCAPSKSPQVFELCRDGWPRILSVACLDDDKLMQIIVGGTTTAGKCVGLWSYDHGKLSQLTEYETPP